MYAKWIKTGLEKPGKSAIGLAAAITKALKLKKAMHRVTVHKMTSGIRKVKSEELVPISLYIEEPIPNIPLSAGSEVVQIEREIGLGIWFEPGIAPRAKLGTIEVSHDIEFPTSRPVAYAFKGDSMVNAGILNGDIVICIPVEQNYSVAEGQYVIVERSRAGLVELSARVVSKFADRAEFRVCSDNDNKPVVVSKKQKNGRSSENETVRVVAIIRRSVRIFV